MQSVRILPSGLVGLLALLACAGAASQDAADNILPVGRVCLEGQACVGTLVEAPAARSAAPAEPAREATEPARDAMEPVRDAMEPAREPAEPADGPGAAPAPAVFDVEAAYQRSCFACHASGAGGAPKPDDAEAWEARLEKGMDAVMANVIGGIGTMPPKGLCFDCSDGELRAVVDFMLAR